MDDAKPMCVRGTTVRHGTFVHHKTNRHIQAFEQASPVLFVDAWVHVELETRRLWRTYQEIGTIHGRMKIIFDAIRPLYHFDNWNDGDVWDFLLPIAWQTEKDLEKEFPRPMPEPHQFVLNLQ